jgi:hypothetical protein
MGRWVSHRHWPALIVGGPCKRVRLGRSLAIKVVIWRDCGSNRHKFIAQEASLMISKNAIFVAFAFMMPTISATARAEDCQQYPPGPFRFECASRQHPGLSAKRERCRQEAINMGLFKSKPAVVGGFRGYVEGCMHRSN